MIPTVLVTGAKRPRDEAWDAASSSSRSARRPRVARVTPDVDRLMPHTPFDTRGAYAAHALRSGGAVGGYVGALRDAFLPAAATSFLKFGRSRPEALGGGGAARASSAADRSPLSTPSARPCDILDAPEILDDFYINVVDWSCRNTLSVGLGDAVYLMDAATKGVRELASFLSPVCATRWAPGGGHVAVATNGGAVRVYDVGAGAAVRDLGDLGPGGRAAALDWNPSTRVLSCGCRDGGVREYDLRRPGAAPVALRPPSGAECCGVRWSPDGSTLATGDNGNALRLWDARSSAAAPRFASRAHRAAVKALAWSPLARNLLASGGGTADRKIRLWRTATGARAGCVDAGSQVTGIAWSKTAPALISSHGYSQNQLTVWSHDAPRRTLESVAHLRKHTARILHLAQSPDGAKVASVGADELFIVWDVFDKAAVDPRPFALSRNVTRWDRVFASARGLR